jgi:hypothetical protein
MEHKRVSFSSNTSDGFKCLPSAATRAETSQRNVSYHHADKGVRAPSKLYAFAINCRST